VGDRINDRLRSAPASGANDGTREVVLLEAIDEDALRRTHRRYFEDLSELAQSQQEVD
jgi:hypothetical protein